MLWINIRNTAIRFGLEPWLRPIVERIRGQEPEEGEVETERLIDRLTENAVCVDVGCHKGKVLDLMRRAAPAGRFFAFEPVPYLSSLLKRKYRSDGRVQVFSIAVASETGERAFFVNESHPGLSGLSERCGWMNDKLQKLTVPVDTLDRIIGQHHVDFIKIDVEGADYEVLKGAQRMLSRCRPVVLFEFGIGGANYFGVYPDIMYNFLIEIGYAVYTVGDYLSGQRPLDLAKFKQHFDLCSQYNFVAAPESEVRCLPGPL